MKADNDSTISEQPTTLPVSSYETRTSPADGSICSGAQHWPLCSIIIPVYNRAPLTCLCLDTLLNNPSEGGSFEIIVVDDASTDATHQLLASYQERIRVVTHTTNIGFAGACNDGARAASGKYLVFLNNDVVPRPGWLNALVRYAESHPDAAIVGSKLLYPNDTIQHAGVVICQDSHLRHLYAGFPTDHPAVNKSRRFQAVTAASVLVRREPFEQMGGFDTAFRNGFEDVDLCLRLGRRGHEVHYCHESTLCHLESVSEDRFANDEDNRKLFYRRWAHRLRPDELQYYLEDGLLNVSYAQSYPIRLVVSPLLATVNGDEYARQTNWLLNARSQQVFELLKETTRLTVRLVEAELRAATVQQPELRRRLRELNEQEEVAQFELNSPQPVAAKQAELPQTPAKGSERIPRRETELRAMLLDAHEQLLRRDEELESMVYDLQTFMGVTLQQDLLDVSATTSAAEPNSVPSKYLGYRQLVRRIRETVHTALPPRATVIVESKGDEELLKLGDGRKGWHFPQDEHGAYAGYHPADSSQAIAHLEELRAKGAQFLLFPETSFWWLEHYAEFREHLDTQYRVAVRREDTCLVFALHESKNGRLNATHARHCSAARSPLKRSSK